MSPFLSFYQFLVLPRYNIDRSEGILKNVSEVLILFVVVFFLTIILIGPLMSLLDISEMDHAMETLMETMPSWKLALMAIVAAPVIEELIFRFPIKYPFVMEILVIFFLGMVTQLVLGSINSTLSLVGVSVVVLYRLSILFGSLTNENQSLKYKENYHKHFPIYFYGVAGFFAYVHVFNFSLGGDQWWMTPILVLPQLVLALLLGFVRMKYGFVYAILVHAMNNSIPIGALILAQHLGVELK